MSRPKKPVRAAAARATAASATAASATATAAAPDRYRVARRRPRGGASSAPPGPRRAMPYLPTRGDDKRRRILDAALRVFAERGYHGTTVPLVALEAHVSAGTIYVYFENKEALVNEVYRDAKARLRDALLADLQTGTTPRESFNLLWARLLRFARKEPDAFQFLELRDHSRYLDAESRALEAEVLLPIRLATEQVQREVGTRALGAGPAIALVWGAFVGLLKAEQFGYLTLDDTTLDAARDACFDLISSNKTSRRAT